MFERSLNGVGLVGCFRESSLIGPGGRADWDGLACFIAGKEIFGPIEDVAILSKQWILLSISRITFLKSSSFEDFDVVSSLGPLNISW